MFHLVTDLFSQAGRRDPFYLNRIILKVPAFLMLSPEFFGILFDFNLHFLTFDLSSLKALA
jgi:hypothetical protein